MFHFDFGKRVRIFSLGMVSVISYWFLSKLLRGKKEDDEKLRKSGEVLKQAILVANLGIFDHNQRNDEELSLISGNSEDSLPPNWRL